MFMLGKRNFCEISPLTYKISVKKEKIKRYLKWITSDISYSKVRADDSQLPVLLYSHNSLIRRKLGNVDPVLQENKANNLKLAAPRVNGILIRPGEVFSFWKIVGECTKKKGFKEGLIISNSSAGKGIGGGMCQFTNLIHWMVLHTDLTITEHHHHNQFDLFPDFNRVIPFGTGTSIAYNYLDYQFMNNTQNTYQLIVGVTDTHLEGEIRSEFPERYKVHILEKNAFFSKETDGYYRNNQLYKKVIDKKTGNVVSEDLLIQNHSKVLYDIEFISPDLIKIS